MKNKPIFKLFLYLKDKINKKINIFYLKGLSSRIFNILI